MKTLVLEAVGTQEFPRWRIASTDKEYWDGNDWVADPRKGLLYADVGLAARDSDELLRLQYGDKPCLKRVTVPLMVEVRSDQPIDPEALKAWLKKAATMYVDYRQHGNGPDNSLALLAINWEEVK